MALPFFTRTASAESYGGGTNKRDYGVPGPVNPLTDVTAEQLRRLAADLAGVARMVPFARLRVLTREYGTDNPRDPIVLDCLMPFGASGEYEGDDPPIGFPTVERTDVNEFRITIPASVTDAAGNDAAAVIRFPMVGSDAEVSPGGETDRSRSLAFTGTTVDISVVPNASNTNVVATVELA
jgi:hypothetical protein